MERDKMFCLRIGDSYLSRDIFGRHCFRRDKQQAIALSKSDWDKMALDRCGIEGIEWEER